MQRCAFTAYEGKKPYIFVSYAHKDAYRVFPILEELDRRGYRVWYDDGIAPGSEWPENIAQHLDGCSLMLAFVSPASIASANCRREVTFALSKRKPFLGILLEPTEMSLGMELQLSAQQCIMKYTYEDDEKFFTKVCSCPDLAPCLGQRKEVPVIAAQPAITPVVTPREKKPMDKKLVGILAGAAGVLAVLAVLLVILLPGKDSSGDGNLGLSGSTPGSTPTVTTDPTDSSSTPPAQDLDGTFLSFYQQTITAEDIAYIQQHRQLKDLEFSGCTFEAGALSQLTAPAGLETVKLYDCAGVSDLTALAALEKLSWLTVTGCDVTDAVFAPFCSTDLIMLDLSNNPQLTDLSVFSNCTNLEFLDFSYTAVASLDALAAMEQLTDINGSYSQVRSIDSLAAKSELSSLAFAGCELTAIEGAFTCLRLAELDLSDNQLTDLTAFENCAALEQVNLSCNALTSAYPISKSAEMLRMLNLSYNESLNANNVSFLSEANAMEALYLDGVQLLNLDLLANMTKLRALRASDCMLSDIDGLANTVGQLEFLYLAHNAIDGIAVLDGLRSEDMVLDLSYNSGLQDVSRLSTACHYRVLNLVNDYLDLATVSGDLRGACILLKYQTGMEDSTWLQRNAFDYAYITYCPLDKIVAMENALGAIFDTVSHSEEDYSAVLTSLYGDLSHFADLIQ